MTQATTHDVLAVGNAIVDVLAPCEPRFLTEQQLAPGSMQLVDEARISWVKTSPRVSAATLPI